MQPSLLRIKISILILKYVCTVSDNCLPRFLQRLFPQLAQNRCLESHPKPPPIPSVGQLLALPFSLTSISSYTSVFTACSYVQVSRRLQDVDCISNPRKRRSKVNKCLSSGGVQISRYDTNYFLLHTPQ